MRAALALEGINLIRNTPFTLRQCLSQDLETVCLKLAVVKFWGVQIFKGDHNILMLIINMYKFIKIRHYIIKQCHGNKEMKKFNYKLEIFRNSTLQYLGVLRGSF